MTRLTQEHSARRISPGTSYDCELPPDVRAELTPPKRPRILTPTEDPTTSVLLILLGIVAVVAIGATVCLLHPPGEVLEKPAAQSVPAPQSTPTPVPAPTQAPSRLGTQPPAPDWRSDGAAYGRARMIGQPAPAPRAMLVRLPAPRAQLIAPPVGTTFRIAMPYGESVRVTYLGRSPGEAALPLIGNSYGDMRLVGETPWVWVTVPGTSTPTWVDP